MSASTERILNRLRYAAIVSTLLVLPLVFLELAFNREGTIGGRVALFGFIWLLQTAFIVILRVVAGGVRAVGASTNPVALAVGVGALLLIGLLWVGVVVDQAPCFIGAPNCD